MRSHVTANSSLLSTTLAVARACGLVALFVTFGAAPASATSITQFYSTEQEVNDFIFPSDEAENPTYIFRVGFDEVLRSFQLTITDHVVESASIGATFNGVSYRCVDMAKDEGSSSCVEFVASGEYGPQENAPPIEGVHYAAGAGAVNVGVSYNITGFPTGGDPVDIGETNNFSSFVVFAHIFSCEFCEILPGTDYVFGHLHDSGGSYQDITFGEHCGGDSIDQCAEDNGFSFTEPVPEPSTVLMFGASLIGLAWFGRRRQAIAHLIARTSRA